MGWDGLGGVRGVVTIMNSPTPAAYSLAFAPAVAAGHLSESKCAEQLQLFWNPSLDASAIDLGQIRPRLNVSRPITVRGVGVDVGGRAVSLPSPAASSQGYVMYDYISVLPADGGIVL